MIIDRIALILAVIGGLNWGLVGLFRFDLVAFLFGDMSWRTDCDRQPDRIYAGWHCGGMVHFAALPRAGYDRGSIKRCSGERPSLFGETAFR